jgi:UDP-GlcNAc3NAcA epimerase
MKIIAIVGARPQFIKHFSFEKACENKLELITIHTGQHYDANMSDVFFHQLGMNKPNYMLNIGSGKHGEQTARMMIEIENIIEDEHPDGIVIYGDTNSSLSGALVASKIGTPIFHIEAGLRSFNREMPEEINRVLVDHLSSVLFTPSNPAVLNLEKEGILDGVHTVGDIMKDLVRYAQKEYLINQNSVDEKYYYVTIHRPYNTDDPERLGYVLQKLNDLDNKIILSLHPRTKSIMEKYNMHYDLYPNISFIEPQSYFSNLTYLNQCAGLITDSGGMQKEAYWLQKKCVTIRKETEWLETIELKGNELIFENLNELGSLINQQPKIWDNKLYGDGNSAQLMVDIIMENLHG